MGSVGNVAMRFSCGVKSANFGVMVVGGGGYFQGHATSKNAREGVESSVFLLSAGLESTAGLPLWHKNNTLRKMPQSCSVCKATLDKIVLWLDFKGPQSGHADLGGAPKLK